MFAANLPGIVDVVQECMTGTLPGTERAEQLGVNRTTVWRRQGRVVSLVETTMTLHAELANEVEDFYLDARKLLSTHEGGANREQTLELLQGTASPGDAMADVAAARVKFQSAVTLAEKLFAAAEELYESAAQLVPEADEAAEAFGDLRDALEQLRDFALLSGPRIRRAATLLGITDTQAA